MQRLRHHLIVLSHHDDIPNKEHLPDFRYQDVVELYLTFPLRTLRVPGYMLENGTVVTSRYFMQIHELHTHQLMKPLNISFWHQDKWYVALDNQQTCSSSLIFLDYQQVYRTPTRQHVPQPFLWTKVTKLEGLVGDDIFYQWVTDSYPSPGSPIVIYHEGTIKLLGMSGSNSLGQRLQYDYYHPKGFLK